MRWIREEEKRGGGEEEGGWEAQTKAYEMNIAPKIPFSSICVGYLFLSMGSGLKSGLYTWRDSVR